VPPRPKSDSELLDFIADRAEAVRKSYDTMYGRWRRALRYYYGQPDTYDKTGTLPTFNAVWPKVETQLAYRLAARPTIFIRAFTAEMDEIADRVDIVVAEHQYRMRINGTLPRVLRCCSQIGTAFLGLFWDEPYGQGKPGRIRTEFVNPAEIVIDPKATRIEDAEWLFRERYITAKEIRTRFPDMVSSIPDLPKVDLEEDKLSRDIFQIAGQPSYERGKKGKEDQEDLYQYVEAWTDNGRVLTKMLGKKFVKESGKHYPMENPYKHGKIPYIPFYGNEDTFGFWGISDVEWIQDAQDQANKRRQQQVLAFDVAQKLMKVYYVSGVKGFSPDVLSSMDFQAQGLDDISQLPRVTDLSGIVQFMDMLQSFIGEMDQASDEAMSQYEAQRGGRMKGVYSGRHQAQILAMSEQRFGPQLESMNYSMRLLGEQLLLLIEQFYTLEGQDQAFSDGKRKVKTRDEDGELMLPELQDPEDFPAIETRFQIVVQPQDEKPMSRQAQVQDLLQLMQMQGVDIETTIRAMRLPNGDDMLDLMAKKNAAGMPPLQPMPQELVDLFYNKALEDAKLAAEQQEVERQKVRMQLEQEKMMLAQGMQQPQQYAQPQGGIPVAGPAGPPQQGMPPEAAQMQAEAQYQNVGQPPA